MLLVGCDPPGKPKEADRPIPSDQVVDFGKLYRQNCAGCHGLNGQMGPAPPLNDELFRSILPEQELETVLLQGRKGTLMPAFAQENGGTLTKAQIQVLVKEIKGLPSKSNDREGKTLAWGRVSEPSPGIPTYKDVPLKSDNLDVSTKRGIAAFARACADCHGEHGQGQEKDHHIINAINDPVFLALNSNQILRRIIITGRSDLGMPNYAETRPNSPEFKPLTEQEVSDLVALLASWRRGSPPKAQPE